MDERVSVPGVFSQAPWCGKRWQAWKEHKHVWRRNGWGTWDNVQSKEDAVFSVYQTYHIISF